MQIKSVKSVGKRKVYDISVKDAEHYVLENGVVTHNTGSYYSADNIFIIGRQQEKEGTEVIGYDFIVNVEKSRYVKEKSKIPITVNFNGGINKWSGLLEIALESKHVVKPTLGWYARVDADGIVEDKKIRAADTNNKEFWLPILKQKSFQDYIERTYRVSRTEIMDAENYSEE